MRIGNPTIRTGRAIITRGTTQIIRHISEILRVDALLGSATARLEDISTSMVSVTAPVGRVSSGMTSYD
jgi:hypothetical protein